MSRKPIYQVLVEKHGFSPAQKIIIAMVPEKSLVLEVGSSSGYMTGEFQKKGCLVDVTEANSKAAQAAKKWARSTFVGSVEDQKVRDKIREVYDVIICADVLEHLVDPEVTLEFLKKKLKKGGFFLISLPNVAYWDMRLRLLFRGDFTYQESGLLDKTHLRFYTYYGFLDLLKRHKLKIDQVLPAEGRIPLEHSISKIPILGGVVLGLWKGTLMKRWPNLNFYHYVVKASLF